MHRLIKNITVSLIALLGLISLGLISINLLAPPNVYAQSPAESQSNTTSSSSSLTNGQGVGCTSGSTDPICQSFTREEVVDGNQCGRGDDAVHVSINLGCRGKDYPGGDDVNPITDLAFALFRLLSAGVGILVIGSVVVAGIQYTTSRGNPQSTEAAIKRITSSFTALVIYMFIFAIANFLVPGGLFI